MNTVQSTGGHGGSMKKDSKHDTWAPPYGFNFHTSVRLKLPNLRTAYKLLLHILPGSSKTLIVPAWNTCPGCSSCRPKAPFDLGTDDHSAGPGPLLWPASSLRVLLSDSREV
ncbi:hypothetical protein MSG28_013893 [Choristoneura fumiferana]|uniref:Uncharacterized protein n=1 Tax=Choristoneura fumiferana TaxID=7141 RepID=A0ACC0K983_CHOFU|nr:hypothetical protein MSG28_013893 [Choristoneura fumiferana]